MDIHEFKSSLLLLSFTQYTSLSDSSIRFYNAHHYLSVYIYLHTSIIEVYISNQDYSFNSYNEALIFITNIITNKEK